MDRKNNTIHCYVCSYLLFFFVLSRTMAEKNIHEFTTEERKKRTHERRSPWWTQWKRSVERKCYCFLLFFFFSLLIASPHSYAVIMYAHFVVVDTEWNQIYKMCANRLWYSSEYALSMGLEFIEWCKYGMHALIHTNNRYSESHSHIPANAFAQNVGWQYQTIIVINDWRSNSLCDGAHIQSNRQFQ